MLSLMSQSGLLETEPPEALPEALPDALPEEHDALTAIVNAAIATHLFENFSRMDSLEEQVNGLQERLLALEQSRAEPKARRSRQGGAAEDRASDTDSPRTRKSRTSSVDNWRMMNEVSSRMGELQKLEEKVNALASSPAAENDLPTKEFLIHKFNDVAGELTMLREESGIVRDHFAWFEEQIEKWRISWAMFALSATTMKEGDKRDCMERLKEEETRLAHASFKSLVSNPTHDHPATGPSSGSLSRAGTRSLSPGPSSSRAGTQSSASPSSRANTSASPSSRANTAARARTTVDQFLPAPIGPVGSEVAQRHTSGRTVNFASRS